MCVLICTPGGHQLCSTVGVELGDRGRGLAIWGRVGGRGRQVAQARHMQHAIYVAILASGHSSAAEQGGGGLAPWEQHSSMDSHK
jgi:hypothetical protein